jgi:hypothetical protein
LVTWGSTAAYIGNDSTNTIGGNEYCFGFIDIERMNGTYYSISGQIAWHPNAAYYTTLMSGTLSNPASTIIIKCTTSYGFFTTPAAVYYTSW